MANEQNLKKGKATQFKSGDNAVSNGRKGGLANGKHHRENRTTRQILKTVLDGDVSTLQQFAPLARKLGLESDKSIKEVYTILCLLNSVKTANLGDLERLQKVLGEDKQDENASVIDKLDKVIGEVDKLAK